MPINPLYNKEELRERRQRLRRKATYSEKVLWQDLRNRKMKGVKFYRQFSIGNFIFDFYCPEVRLAIELDGASHTSKLVQQNDQSKTLFLKQNDISLLRFTDEELLKYYENALRKIETFITRNVKNSEIICNS